MTGCGPQGIWAAGWRWSLDRWWGERPGPLGLLLLGAGVPAAALALGGSAAEPAGVERVGFLGLAAALAALWAAAGVADAPWREGHILWWLQKGGGAADFLALRILLDSALVFALLLLWSAAAATTTALAGGAWVDLLRVLPARALLIVLIISWTALLSAAGAARDSELAALTLIVAAVRPVLFPDWPAWADALARWALPPVAALAETSGALARGDGWAALEAARAPLAYVLVSGAAALWLVRRRAPQP